MSIFTSGAGRQLLGYALIGALVVGHLASIFLAFPRHARADITTGLIGYYQFEDGIGTTVVDSSVSENDGTVYDSFNGDEYVDGHTWTAGKFGGGLQLNGDGSGEGSWAIAFGGGVRVPHIAALETNTLTFAAWVRPVRDDAWQGIIGKRVDDQNEFTIEIFYDEDVFACGSWGNGEYGARSQTTITEVANTWVHVACTLADDMTTKIYVNGSLEGTLPGGDGFSTRFNGSTNAAPIIIGQRLDQTNGSEEWYELIGGFYDGGVDDVRIYNRTLSEEEVAALYAWTGEEEEEEVIARKIRLRGGTRILGGARLGGTAPVQ